MASPNPTSPQYSDLDNTWSDPSNAYIISGSIAAPLLIFVLYTFCRFKRIRSHPAGLHFARTLADTGFIFSTLLLSAVVDDGGLNPTAKAAICSDWGPLIAFFFMSSQFYFIGMCYDLYTTCTYPLRSVSYTARIVHICSWTLSAILTLIFSIINGNGYRHEHNGELCFLGINKSNKPEKIQEWFTFLGPYIIGTLSGLLSLIFVFFRLKNGLGEVFQHATIMVKDHIIFVLLYTILGIAWFILLLQTLGSGGLSFAVSFIIVGTASIDCTTWVLQKFRMKKATIYMYRSTYLGNFLRKRQQMDGNSKDGNIADPDQDILSFEYRSPSMTMAMHMDSNKNSNNMNMSSALRLELIRNMCSGVTQSLDHFTHNREYNTNGNGNGAYSINAEHFSPINTISRMKKGSALEMEYTNNQSIHRFLMASHSSGGIDQIDFIDYSPHVFKYLRANCFSTSETEYAQSVKIAIDNHSTMDELSAKFSEGKSGAFFFMTPNSEFMVKTLRKSEAITFLRILPGYFEHMRKFPHSFITKFYGLYGIKLYGTRLYFTIMKYLFIPDLEPHEKYDIKGSWINRHTKHHIELGKLMKDEDLKKNVLIPYLKSKKAWEQMSHDTRFLNTLNIMDYSLLLGIYYIGISTQNANFSKSNWSFNANATRGGSYKPPHNENENKNKNENESNIELQIHDEKENENEELKQGELKEGDDADDITGIHSVQYNKSDILDLNTMSAMKKDFSKLEDKFSPKGKSSEPALRRRAFTAGTGLTQLSSHPMSYQSRMIEGPGFYLMGIIDILQDYNFEKRIERFFKVFIKCVDGYGISCIEPSMYRKRFLAKMLQIGIGRGEKYHD